VFAFNDGCGIGCYGLVETVLGSNLLWQNTVADVELGGSGCPVGEGNQLVVADPLFCGPEMDNFTVASDSPALTGAVLMGVWTDPGCGPGVHVRPSTWGRLKARYW
jgi:hypothetical protein